MFYGESPSTNFEQKCLCVLVLDVSGSMEGLPIQELNQGLMAFKQEVCNDYIASQRLEIAVFTFNHEVRCIQPPIMLSQWQVPTLQADGTTKLADAVQQATQLIEQRKTYYKQRGEKYFRPMMILFTDGEPDADQNLIQLQQHISQQTVDKKFSFWAVGVKGYNHHKLAQICPPQTPPMPLSGYNFKQFFQWLSASIGLITRSSEGQKVNLPPTSGWSQLEL